VYSQELAHDHGNPSYWTIHRAGLNEPCARNAYISLVSTEAYRLCIAAIACDTSIRRLLSLGSSHGQSPRVYLGLGRTWSVGSWCSQGRASPSLCRETDRTHRGSRRGCTRSTLRWSSHARCHWYVLVPIGSPTLPLLCLFDPTLVECLDEFVLLNNNDGGCDGVIVDQGAVYSWGCGEYGQLGSNSTKNRYYPKRIKSLKHVRVASVTCGHWLSMASVEVGMFRCTICSVP